MACAELRTDEPSRRLREGREIVLIRVKNGGAWGLLLAVLCAQGCANVVGSTQSEIIAGSPVVERGEVRHALVIAPLENESLDPRRVPISTSILSVSAVAIEPSTITTPQQQRLTREVIPYSGVRELIEWPLTILVGWVQVLEGTIGFGDYFDGVNPFMNSDRFSAKRVTETLSETPMQPKIEQRSDTRRVEGARIALGFPGLPRVEMSSKEKSALRVSLDRLMTRSLTSAPRVIEGQVIFKGQTKPVQARVELAPAISDRLLRASRRLRGMDAKNPVDVATTVFDLEKLGFSSRAQKIEQAGIARHGAGVLGRATADIHIANARAALEQEDGKAALASIKLARAEVKRAPKEWNLLEADVHEAAGLGAIEEGAYDRARNDLLKASRLDRGRQARLASFIAISIEAMDRETAREERVSNSASASFAVPASAAAAPRGSTASNTVQQCLAREAALQACRLLPSFGKDICKSGVRSKYSGVACP